MYDASSSDDDIDIFTGLALIGALSKMSGRRGNCYGSDGDMDSSGGVLFTEDNIAVNTIYASFKQNPENVTEATVRKMFEQFGPVKSVRIHTNQNNNLYGDGEVASGGGRGGGRKFNKQERFNRYGFVSFENCEDAAKCIQQKRILTRCYVAIADSWHQEAYHKKQIEAESGAGDACGSSATADHSDSLKPSTVKSSDKFGESNEATAAAPTSADHNATNSKESETSGESEPGGTNILELNDDCLMLIFDKVDLMELIALKKTCSHFEAIACDIFKRYKMFDFDIEPCEKKYLTMLDAKNILTDVGPFVEHLSISRDRFVRPGVRILNLIPRHCPNLKELEIHDFTLNQKTLKGLESVIKCLEGLTLTACGISDTVERTLVQAKLLRRLDLSSNSEITGKCLKAVKNLKYLNLESCQNIQGKPFASFAEKNKTLEYLNISCCSRLTAEAIKSIVKNMTQLTHLICNNCYDNVDPASMALIAKLPKLKKLQFKINSFSPIDQILQSFSETNQLEHLDLSDGIFTAVDYNLLCGLTNLKELKLNYKLDFSDEHLAKLCTKGNFYELHIAGCTNITDKQLIEFINKNPHLRLLDVSYCQVTEGLIFSAIDILKAQASVSGVSAVFSAPRQLKMVVGNTSICTVILENARIKSNRHLLEISFDSTEGFYGAMDSDDLYDDAMDDDDEDFMGYDYEDDDSDMWGLDYDSDLGNFADVYQYLHDSDDEGYRYMFYM